MQVDEVKDYQYSVFVFVYVRVFIFVFACTSSFVFERNLSAERGHNSHASGRE